MPSKRELVLEAARVVVNTPSVDVKLEGKRCLVLPYDVLMALAKALSEHDLFRAQQLSAAGINPDGSSKTEGK